MDLSCQKGNAAGRNGAAAWMGAGRLELTEEVFQPVGPAVATG